MVLYTPHLHHRRSIRLKGYDYSQPGLYFITICCQDRACLFGNVMDGEMKLNDAGKITDEYWMEIPKHFPNTVLHEHIVMPNHIHGIIELTNVRAENIPPRQIESTSSEWAEPVGAKNFFAPTITPTIAPRMGEKYFAPTNRINVPHLGEKYFAQTNAPTNGKYFVPTGIPIQNNRIRCSRF
jgi:REP element-mobilizing transposase RayT